MTIIHRKNENDKDVKKLNSQLPSAVLRYCQEQAWTIHEVKQINGGFAASIYHMQLVDGNHTRDVIYKHFAKGREAEAFLLPALTPLIASISPKIYALIHDEQHADKTIGVLMDDLGDSLKSKLHTLPLAQQKALLRQAMLFLADFSHASIPLLSTLQQNGVPDGYAFASSSAWCMLSLENCRTFLNDNQTMALHRDQVEALCAFYPTFEKNYPTWLTGTQVLTHGDPHLDNWFYQDHKFYLIDWEAASITTSSRDLAIVLQDLLDPTLFKIAFTTYQKRWKELGHDTESDEYRLAFVASFFDNTLMMLGWEIQKYWDHHLTRDTIVKLFTTKLNWLTTCQAILQNFAYNESIDITVFFA